MEPLQLLLKRAPSGFPTFASLRDAFIALDAEWSIFGVTCAKGRHQSARDASDIWRKMCRDVYDHAKSGVNPESLNELVGCIQLGRAGGAASGSQGQPAPSSDAATGHKFADFSSSSDVEITSIKCTCPVCAVPVPAAKAVAQRKETENQGDDEGAPPKRRMTGMRTGAATARGMRRPSAAPDTGSKPPGRVGKKPASVDNRNIALPIDIEYRYTSKVGKPPGAYILQNTAKARYVCGVSLPASPQWKKIIEEVADKIRSKDILTTDACKQWVEARISTGLGANEPTLREPFSEDKKRYNKFNYHLRNAGDEYQNQCAAVKSKEFQDPDGFDRFVEMILALPASERHTGLPDDCGIKWPHNQQVRRVVEMETERMNYPKEDESESKFEDAKLEEASEQFEAAWANKDLSKAVLGGSAHCAPDVSSSSPGKSEAQVKKEKEALQHIKKAHNSWDRIAREVTGFLAISGDHPNTKGCKVEMDLTGALADGKITDAELMKMEVKAMHPSDALTDDDFSNAAALTTKIQGEIKECKRLNDALKSWFKV
ncbi:unnamed protein product [Prorocentrum cordatum]|uniref:Uncharacterized protein n=1 Tax=Prorocentrum cordatum TaxID=2364126 RepID=A0ABN9PB19_9DINO|nr:unnamed protein product [Polarella glacialis]